MNGSTYGLCGRDRLESPWGEKIGERVLSQRQEPRGAGCLDQQGPSAVWSEGLF